jgi:Tfp pilus assembly protein PilV
VWQKFQGVGMTYKLTVAKGFSLVEVLIASLMIMLGVTGYVTLQSEFVMADSRLNLRHLALQIAQEKLDDLASFSQIESLPGVACYNDIANNVGGSIPSGDVTVALGNNQLNTRHFNRTWQVRNKYFVDTDNDTRPDTWVEVGHPKVIPPIPSVAGQKEISINVAWTDYQGNNQSLVLNGTITPIPQSRSLLALSELESVTQRPKIEFTPTSLPDSHNMELGNNKRLQSASPIIVQNDRVDLSFEKYRDVNGIDIKEGQNDFTTVGCRCELAGMGQGMSPAMGIIDHGQLVTVSGQYLQKMTGKPSVSNQSNLCTQCCNDHHDSAQTIADEQYYRIENDQPHSHFVLLENQSYKQALQPGDQYDEICRFKRVEGYFVLYPDWQLIELVVLSPDYLLEPSNHITYATYVNALLRSSISHSNLPTRPINRDVSANNAGRQLTARGLYIDPLRSNDREMLQAKIANGESDWLSLTPFYDVNLTLLANWDTFDPVIATITNEPISMFPADIQAYYQIFSRGKLTILSSGSTIISAKVSASNSTMAGLSPITPFELATMKQDNSVALQ